MVDRRFTALDPSTGVFSASGSRLLGLPRVEGQNETERAALAQLRLHPDLAAVALYEAPADVEAQTGAGDGQVGVGAHPLELYRRWMNRVLAAREPQESAGA